MAPVRGEVERGQVLVLLALLIVILLAFAGLAIDGGRQTAERRHVQTAADAGALAACRELRQGASDATAAQAARDVALANLQSSPAGATATIADDLAREYTSGHVGDPAYLESGIFVAGSTVRVAIRSVLPSTFGRVVGVQELETGARAHCALEGTPAIPIVARRYVNPPGPAGGFTDFLATAPTSTAGSVDTVDPRGYGPLRFPATETQPGPVFELYGPDSKANNDASFRGFVALDVRNFETTTSRVYYNGVTAGISETTLKSKEGDYLIDGYPGPAFPTVTTPSTGASQVAILTGNDSPMVVGNFDAGYDVGDRLLLGVYDGTVMEIPDFSITPPSAITLPTTTTTPINGPSFTVSRNDAFASTVELHLHGDRFAPDPAFDILPDPSVTPPAAGDMNQPTWSTDVFVPAKQGTAIAMNAISTNAVTPGIYTVWLEGHSGNPYYQTRRVPVVVRVNGTGATGTPTGPSLRDFSLGNSISSGSTPSYGGTVALPIYVSTTSTTATKWGGPAASAVSLSWDAATFSTCSLMPASLPSASQIAFSAASVTPSSSGDGALSNLSINTAGLGAGCYSFVIRATGTNGDGQPVTHLLTATFTVASAASSGQYVDVIGFAVFQVTAITSNSISAKAVTGIRAEPGDFSLRRAQLPRLIPWSYVPP
jgi:hypothetical protein